VVLGCRAIFRHGRSFREEEWERCTDRSTFVWSLFRSQLRCHNWSQLSLWSVLQLCITNCSIILLPWSNSLIHSFIYCKNTHTTNVYQRFQTAVENKDLHMNKNNKNTKWNFKTHNTLTAPKTRTESSYIFERERRINDWWCSFRVTTGNW